MSTPGGVPASGISQGKWYPRRTRIGPAARARMPKTNRACWPVVLVDADERAHSTTYLGTAYSPSAAHDITRALGPRRRY